MNKCFNGWQLDSRFPAGQRSSSGGRVQKCLDKYLPEMDPRLMDSPRGMHVPLDAAPISGYIPESERYCNIPSTPGLGYKSRETNASSWLYYLTENQSKPYNPIVYGPYNAQLQDFQDPMGGQKTEMMLKMAAGAGLAFNDLQDEQAHRTEIMSRLQSKMDEQKFGPKYVVRNRPLSCQSNRLIE